MVNKMEITLVDKKIFDFYKEEFLKQNTYIVAKNFYEEGYSNIFDVEFTKLEEYINYINKVNIYIQPTMVDFINALGFISSLQEKSYKKTIVVNYLTMQSIFVNDKVCSYSLAYDDYKEVQDIFFTIVKKKEVSINKLPSVFIIGKIFLKMYNGLVDDKVLLLQLDEVFSEEIDIDSAINSLKNKYPEYGLSTEYYRKIINENLSRWEL